MAVVRIGVVGLGKMGGLHSRALNELSALAAVCDVDAGKVKDLSDRYSVPGYTSFEEMLSKEDLDGIVIATPTSTHFEMAMKAVERGVHLLVEKPMVKSYVEGAKLADAVKKAGIKFGVGHIERFNPAFRRFKAEISERPMFIEFFREGPRPERIKDVGIVLDTMIHDIDLAMDLFGRPVWAFGRVRGEELAHAVLAFKDSTAFMLSSWVSPKKRRGFRAIFDGYVLEVDLLNHEVVRLSRNEEVRLDLEYKEPIKEEDERFVEALEGRSEFPVSIEDGLWAVKVAEAVLLSSRTSVPVYLMR